MPKFMKQMFVAALTERESLDPKLLQNRQRNANYTPTVDHLKKKLGGRKTIRVHFQKPQKDPSTICNCALHRNLRIQPILNGNTLRWIFVIEAFGHWLNAVSTPPEPTQACVTPAPGVKASLLWNKRNAETYLVFNATTATMKNSGSFQLLSNGNGPITSIHSMVQS